MVARQIKEDAKEEKQLRAAVTKDLGVKTLLATRIQSCLEYWNTPKATLVVRRRS